MRIMALVQARLSSHRLPGKVLRTLAGRLVIDRVFAQLGCCKEIDGAVLATSNEQSDDPLADWASSHNIRCYRGPLKDVLSRFVGAAREAAGLVPGDALVRVTADCPLLEPGVADRAIRRFRESDCAYCSNVSPRTFPDGYDVEVIGFTALEQASEQAKEAYDREHVTTYIRTRPDQFKHASIASSVDRSKWRLTLDTPEDLNNLEELLKVLNRNSSCVLEEDIIQAVEHSPELARRIIVN